MLKKHIDHLRLNTHTTDEINCYDVLSLRCTYDINDSELPIANVDNSDESTSVELESAAPSINPNTLDSEHCDGHVASSLSLPPLTDDPISTRPKRVRRPPKRFGFEIN